MIDSTRICVRLRCLRLCRGFLQRLVFALVVLAAINLASEAIAETQQLRESGRTLVEAENFSAASVKFPYAEASEKCSGQSHLGYYWANSWFEMEVDVPRMLNYSISFRASSPTGTKIEIQAVDESGKTKSMALIEVPNTGSFTEFTDTQSATLSLPTGLQSLRFKNLVDGANIDYITFTAGAADDIVSVRPVANEGPDINPMKGFNSGWWRESEDYASVGFQYIEWGKFEPKDDAFDWDYVEEVLNRPGSKNRHFILQFVVDWDDWGAKKPNGKSHYRGPQWLLKRVGENRGVADTDDPKSRITRATKYDHPAFVEEASEAIKALLDHYQDDPRTFVIQVGVLGFWGEWHNFPRTDWSPKMSTKAAILEAYLKNLGGDGLTQLRYPDEMVEFRQSGLGYTNGSATLTEHGYEFGEAVAKARLWENGPIGGEWPPNVESKYWSRFFLTEEGESFLKQGGYSTMLPPEPKEIAERLPKWNQAGSFMKMHRKMGYNFCVKAVRHLVSVDDSHRTHIEVDLANDGIAPIYKNWNVQLAILKLERNGNTAKVVSEISGFEFDLRKLAPGNSTTITGTIDGRLDPRTEYQIGLRILQPGAHKPKSKAWSLDARYTYIALANDIKVIEGDWDKRNALQGGWNILDDVQRREPTPSQPLDQQVFFPLQGSFRPAAEK